MNPVLVSSAARTEQAAPPAPGGPTPSLSRAVVWASGAVVVAASLMAVVGALRTGISWDEPAHVMRLRNYLGHGWFAADWSVQSDASGSGDTNTLVYGPVAMMLLHGLTALLGVEGWSDVATTPTAYDVRHLGVVAIGLGGTVAAAAITRILLDSWRWALLTAAALLALPMWTGHLMFNIKDVPVATGYTLTTLALVSMVAPVRGRRLVRVGGLTAGTVLMVGTRPAMASAVLVGLAVLGAGVLTSGRFGNARAALAEAMSGVILGAGVLLWVYPSVFAHPSSLIRSAEQSASFRDGRDAAYGYVPFFVAAQTPLLLLLLSGTGLAVIVGFVRHRWRTDTAHATRLALVSAQLLVLPLVAIAKHSDLYNALRQLLFTAPAWAVVVAVGLARALTWGRDNRRAGLVSAAAVVALAAPVVDQVTLFPYQYTYYNVALDASGVHVPTDYWRASVPELIPQIPTDGQIVCGPTRSSRLGALAGSPEASGIAESSMLAGRFSSDSSVDCRTDPLGPLAPAWKADGLPYDDALPHNEFYAVIDRDHAVPGNCTRLAGVTRDRHGRRATMTYVARCVLDPSPLDETPVAFTRPDGVHMAPQLWSYLPEGWVARASMVAVDATGSSASLWFAAPKPCARRTCVLELDADAPDDLTAAVDGTTARITTGHGPVLVALPPGVTDTWVTFNRASGGDLDLRVRTIRVLTRESS